jgi:hypothetical protein
MCVGLLTRRGVWAVSNVTQPPSGGARHANWTVTQIDVTTAGNHAHLRRSISAFCFRPKIGRRSLRNGLRGTWGACPTCWQWMGGPSSTVVGYCAQGQSTDVVLGVRNTQIGLRNKPHNSTQTQIIIRTLMVKALCYKLEGRGLETRWGERIFSIRLILPAALGPGDYSASNINEYQNKKKKRKECFWGVKCGRRVRLTNLIAICEPIV